MANGVDMIFSEIVLELKQEFPHIRHISVRPYLRQSSKWCHEDQERYLDILNNSEDILINENFCKGCYKQRNQFLVDHAKYIICVRSCGDYKSGTSQTLKMAKNQHPKHFEQSFHLTLNEK